MMVMCSVPIFSTDLVVTADHPILTRRVWLLPWPLFPAGQSYPW